MTRAQMTIVAALFGVAFAATNVLRGDVAPGLVGGLLGGTLLYLVLLRLREQHEARRRRRGEPE